MEFAPARKDIARKTVNLVNCDEYKSSKVKMWTNKTIKHQIFQREDLTLHYPSSKKGYAERVSTYSELVHAKTNFKQAIRQEIDEGIAFANLK